MANTFLDPIKKEVDALDDFIDKIDTAADAAKNWPFVGPMIASYVGTFDTVRNIADSLRKKFDALDPVATAAVAAAPEPVKAQAATATTVAVAAASVPVDPSAKPV
jgi:hypothetical protein